MILSLSDESDPSPNKPQDDGPKPPLANEPEIPEGTTEPAGPVSFSDPHPICPEPECPEGPECPTLQCPVASCPLTPPINTNPAPLQPTTGGTGRGLDCHFPFSYKGKKVCQSKHCVSIVWRIHS